MKGLLILVGVVAIAGVMYVTAASGGPQSARPTERQFKALKRQVTTLGKTLKTVRAMAADADGFIRTCLATGNAKIVPVNQFGNATTGFLFGTTSGATSVRTALAVDPSPTPGAFLLGVDPSCAVSLMVVFGDRTLGAGVSWRIRHSPVRAGVASNIRPR